MSIQFLDREEELRLLEGEYQRESASLLILPRDLSRYLVILEALPKRHRILKEISDDTKIEKLEDCINLGKSNQVIS